MVNKQHRGTGQGASLLLAAFTLLVLVLSGCYHIPVGNPVPLETVKSTPDTAIFSFSAIEVSPLPVTTGQTITISLNVENTGTAADTYKADLYINGTLLSSQAVAVSPGNKGLASFQTTPATAGKYELKIGPQTRTIDVAEKRIQATLKASGDMVDGFDPLIGSTSDPTQVHGNVEGYLIQLTAPAEGFVINSLRVLGYIKSSTYDYDNDPIYGPGIWVYGQDIALAEPIRSDFTVNIYDIKRTKLYTGNFNKDRFTNTPGWVVLDIPSVRVAGDFLIEINAYNPPRLNAKGWGDWDLWHRYVLHTWYYQLCLGYENSVNVQSWVSQDGSILPDVYLTYNWLIQAGGYKQ